VGSNIDPEDHIPRALRALKRNVRVTASSTFYLTFPIGKRDDPQFYNGVWQLETALSPRKLKFGILRAIEEQQGRVRDGNPSRPREIDLDLILYDKLVLEEPDLQLPDPEIRTRPFLALPLAELEPYLTLPGTTDTISRVAEALVEQKAENHERGPVSRGGMKPLPEFTANLRKMLKS